MIMKQSLAILAPVLALAAVWLAAPPPARAGTITETVTVNTSSFVGSSNPFEVFFTLSDGSGTADGNNSVTLSGFSFGTGGAAGAVDTANTANAGGSLSSGVTMNDATFSDSFAAFFTPGSSLSFTFTDTFASLDTPTLDSAAGTTAVYTDTNTADSVGTPAVGSPVSTPEPQSGLLLAAGLGLVA